MDERESPFRIHCDSDSELQVEPVLLDSIHLINNTLFGYLPKNIEQVDYTIFDDEDHALISIGYYTNNNYFISRDSYYKIFEGIEIPTLFFVSLGYIHEYSIIPSLQNNLHLETNKGIINGITLSFTQNMQMYIVQAIMSNNNIQMTNFNIHYFSQSQLNSNHIHSFYYSNRIPVGYNYLNNHWLLFQKPSSALYENCYYINNYYMQTYIFDNILENYYNSLTNILFTVSFEGYITVSKPFYYIFNLTTNQSASLYINNHLILYKNIEEDIHYVGPKEIYLSGTLPYVLIYSTSFISVYQHNMNNFKQFQKNSEKNHSYKQNITLSFNSINTLYFDSKNSSYSREYFNKYFSSSDPLTLSFSCSPSFTINFLHNSILLYKNETMISNPLQPLIMFDSIYFAKPVLPRGILYNLGCLTGIPRVTIPKTLFTLGFKLYNTVINVTVEIEIIDTVQQQLTELYVMSYDYKPITQIVNYIYNDTSIYYIQGNHNLTNAIIIPSSPLSIVLLKTGFELSINNLYEIKPFNYTIRGCNEYGCINTYLYVHIYTCQFPDMMMISFGQFSMGSIYIYQGNNDIPIDIVTPSSYYTQICVPLIETDLFYINSAESLEYSTRPTLFMSSGLFLPAINNKDTFYTQLHFYLNQIDIAFIYAKQSLFRIANNIQQYINPFIFLSPFRYISIYPSPSLGVYVLQYGSILFGKFYTPGITIYHSIYTNYQCIFAISFVVDVVKYNKDESLDDIYINTHLYRASFFPWESISIYTYKEKQNNFTTTTTIYNWTSTARVVEDTIIIEYINNNTDIYTNDSITPSPLYIYTDTQFIGIIEIPTNTPYYSTVIHISPMLKKYQNCILYNTVNEPSSNWNHVYFDYSDWSEVSFNYQGNMNGITSYFRYTFTINILNTLIGIEYELYTQFGFILYINGHEIRREMLPKNKNITYSTYSTSFYNNNNHDYIGGILSTDFFTYGTNIFAYEIHRFFGITNVYGPLQPISQVKPFPFPHNNMYMNNINNNINMNNMNNMNNNINIINMNNNINIINMNMNNMNINNNINNNMNINNNIKKNMNINNINDNNQIQSDHSISRSTININDTIHLNDSYILNDPYPIHIYTDISAHSINGNCTLRSIYGNTDNYTQPLFNIYNKDTLNYIYTSTSPLPVYINYTYNQYKHEYINKVIIQIPYINNNNVNKNIQSISITVPEYIQIQASNDDDDNNNTNNWTTLYSINKKGYFEQQLFTYIFYIEPYSIDYRYYRIAILSTSDTLSSSFSISFVGFYLCRRLTCPTEGIWNSISVGETQIASCDDSYKGYMYRKCTETYISDTIGYITSWEDIDRSGCLSTLPPYFVSYLDTTICIHNILPYFYNIYINPYIKELYMNILEISSDNIIIHQIIDCSIPLESRTCIVFRLITNYYQSQKYYEILKENEHQYTSLFIQILRSHQLFNNNTYYSSISISIYNDLILSNLSQNHYITLYILISIIIGSILFIIFIIYIIRWTIQRNKKYKQSNKSIMEKKSILPLIPTGNTTLSYHIIHDIPNINTKLNPIESIKNKETIFNNIYNYKDSSCNSLVSSSIINTSVNETYSTDKNSKEQDNHVTKSISQDELIKQKNCIQNNYIQNNYIQNNYIQNNHIQNNYIQNNHIQNNYIQNNYIQNNHIQNINSLSVHNTNNISSSSFTTSNKQNNNYNKYSTIYSPNQDDTQFNISKYLPSVISSPFSSSSSSSSVSPSTACISKKIK
ncbi:hypothetical protein WA158_006673 [Blastocystis sp. Blastoise]